MSYEELTRSAQVETIRRHARRAVAAYPIEVRSLRLVHHGFNTTWRVDATDGRRMALRINVNSRRTVGQITAEQAWLRALAAETDLRVPVPQVNRDGAFITVLPNEELGRPLPAVLYSWLLGRNLGDGASLAQMRTVGAAAAALHSHAEGWVLPVGAELSLYDTTLLDQPNHFAEDHALLTAGHREVIDHALAEADRHLAALFEGARPIVTHQDLHNDNLRWHEGRLAVFDFDDCGIGVPVQDLAIAAYYRRDDARQEAALLEGYAARRPLPAFTGPQYESLFAGRNLVLLNDMLTITTADLRALLPRYLHNSVVKLRHWLDTGTYRHEVPGLRSD